MGELTLLDRKFYYKCTAIKMTWCGAKKCKQKWNGIKSSGGDPHMHVYLVD